VSAVFSLEFASVSFSVSRSPVGCPAPSPGEVAVAAESCGAAFFGLRPSSRSFSSWVAVLWFASPGDAGAFAELVAESFALPFCAVRSCGSWSCVSVPVSVRAFEVRGRSLPFLLSSLGG